MFTEPASWKAGTQASRSSQCPPTAWMACCPLEKVTIAQGIRLAPKKLLVNKRPHISGHPVLWSKGGLARMSMKDTVFSLTLLSLEYQELDFVFPEAAGSWKLLK